MDRPFIRPRAERTGCGATAGEGSLQMAIRYPDPAMVLLGPTGAGKTPLGEQVVHFREVFVIGQAVARDAPTRPPVA